MKALIVSEYYPRRGDPVLGIWAHRQAVATRAAGVDVEVVVLHRPIPPIGGLLSPRAWRTATAQPAHDTIDGIDVTYVRYPSPPRPVSYGRWGKFAAPWLRRALRGREYDLVHAHNSVPAAEALARAGADGPLVVSVHGGDVYFTAGRWREQVQHGFAAADLVLANSAGTARKVSELGFEAEVLHLGTDIPPVVTRDRDCRTVVTVAHLVARKRHADVIRAVGALDGWRYLIIGDGPERAALATLAREVGADVEFAGQLPPDAALERARRCAVFAMPSTDEAFGVAYVEAMAGGLPAIGASGEPGPAEIPGVDLVAPGDVPALARAIERAAEDDGSVARAVAGRLSWEACGTATAAAYERVLAR